MTENMPDNPMNRAPRCGARTRRQTACECPAMKNGRCKFHGGKSTGAPKGNSNALKHGLRSAQMRLNRALLREMIASLANL